MIIIVIRICGIHSYRFSSTESYRSDADFV